MLAILLAIAATGLNLALGFEDRRRDWVILRASGARGWKLASFVWSEAGVVLQARSVAGTIVGAAVAQILIVVLQGVFDPLPEAPNIP